MAKKSRYPLEQVIEIKTNRFDQAVRTLEEKKGILEKAYEALFDLNQALDEINSHKAAKLNQIRDALDEGTSSDKIQQMKVYLKVVDEKAIEQKKKRDNQQTIVDEAQKQVDLATDDLFQKKKDLEKLELHKKDWEKEDARELERKEESEHDEQGSAGYHRLKRDKQKRDN